jgi:hypothetical protein
MDIHVHSAVTGIWHSIINYKKKYDFVKVVYIIARRNIHMHISIDAHIYVHASSNDYFTFLAFTHLARQMECNFQVEKQARWILFTASD